MYLLTAKRLSAGFERFEQVQTIHLFGCHQGYIPMMLRRVLSPDAKEPCMWHLDVADELTRTGYAGHALVINLKPKSAAGKLGLYELAEVWGYSDREWTPLMMRLRALVVDDTSGTIDANRFEVPTTAVDDPVFSMTYVHGSVCDGQLTGRWTPPPASPTNSVLLWPKAFNYFVNSAGRVRPVRRP